MPDQLNRQQRLAYEIIKHFNEFNKQLLMIMIGTAGTGKSFTITAISYYLQSSLVKAAPTAKVVFIINGKTNHSTFQIPATNTKNSLTALKNKQLKDLQDKFEKVKFIIIGEYSMIGNL